MYKIPCSKCNGLGRIQGFAMVAGGTCFQCKGIGYKESTKTEYEAYKRKQEKIKEMNKRSKEKKQLEDYLWNNAKHLKNNIMMVIDIKLNEDIETNPEAKHVYDRQKGRIKDFLTKYKQYKRNYNLELKNIDDILKEYNITCVNSLDKWDCFFLSPDFYTVNSNLIPIDPYKYTCKLFKRLYQLI